MQAGLAAPKKGGGTRTQPGRDLQPPVAMPHTQAAEHPDVSLAKPPTPQEEPGRHPRSPTPTCRDGVEAQGEGRRVPQLHRDVDVGQRGTQDDRRDDLGVAPAGRGAQTGCQRGAASYRAAPRDTLCRVSQLPRHQGPCTEGAACPGAPSEWQARGKKPQKQQLRLSLPSLVPPAGDRRLSAPAFLRQQPQPVRKLLVAVVDDAGVEQHGSREVNGCDLEQGERGVAASSGRELNRSPPGGRERTQRPLTCTLVFRELRHTMRWRLWDSRRPSGEGEEQK